MSGGCEDPEEGTWATSKEGKLFQTLQAALNEYAAKNDLSEAPVDHWTRRAIELVE